MDQWRAGVSENQAPAPSDFSERLVDAFFRRWALYLVPVALLSAIGVYTASNITADYASDATLSAASNPFLSQPTIRGTEISPFESPADGTARLINEQLQTDAFIDEVAERAGLAEAIDAGRITRVALRSRVGAGATGQNTMQIGARWADPDTAYRLVQGTIEGYTEYIAELASADSLEAIEFWTGQKSSATDEARAAEEAFDAYVSQLPPAPADQERPVEEILEIQRLDAAVERALEAERDAQDRVDEAELTAKQAANNSTREFTVIDAPEIATSPAPVRREQATAIAVFTLLGLLIAGAALVLGTVADRAVRTRAQLSRATGIGSVVVVPRIKQLRRRTPTSTPPSDKAA